MLFILLTIWFLSPLALGIWLLVTKKKAKKQRDVLERLYRRGELKTEDAIAAGLLKKQSISQKPAAAEPPIANPEEKPQGAVVTEKPPKVTSPPPEPVKPKKEKQPISAISILLAVGVTLVIIAGLLFVRSTWETLSDGGRLAVLGAGSLLFFGASALANKVWHLKRTGAAFFTLGTAFFPISVWAAGSFALLGKGLAGASNPWLLSLAAASFTILACLAVRKEKQIGWSIAVMAGFSVTYACLCRGIIKNDGVFFLAITAYVLLLAYAVKPLAHKFPPYISKAAELFAIAAAFCAIPLLLLAEKNTTVLFGIGALMLVAAFLSEPISSRLKAGTAFVACGLVVCGFAMALHPFYRHNFAWGDGNFSAFIGILTAVVMMTLHAMERNSKAEQLSYRLAYYVTAGFSQVALWSCVFDDGQLHWLTYPAEIVLLLVTLLPLLRTQKLPLRIAFAIEAQTLMVLPLCLDALYSWENENCIIFVALLMFAAAIIFTFVRPIRSKFSDFLLPISSGVFTIIALLDANDKTAFAPNCASVLFFLIAVLFWFYVMEHNTRSVRQFFEALLCPAAAIIGLMAVTECSVIAKADWSDEIAAFIWGTFSVAFAVLTVVLSKNRVNFVRMTALLALLLPVFFMLFELVDRDCGWISAAHGICAAGIGVLGVAFARRGMRRWSTISFIMVVPLLYIGTVVLGNSDLFSAHLYPDENAPVLYAGIWFLVGTAISVLVQKGKLHFVGTKELTNALSLVVPMGALMFGHFLYDNTILNATQTVYITAALIFCACGWCATKPTQWLFPSIAVCASVFALEELRIQVFDWDLYFRDTYSNGLLIAFFAVWYLLLALFCYLGILMQNHQPRRAWSMRIAAAMLLFWGFSVCTQREYAFIGKQEDACIFAWLVGVTLFAMHFLLIVKNKKLRQIVISAAAAMAMITLWCQPFFQTKGTYFEDKLFLLPLLGFGLILRKQYGKKLGGAMFFAIGVFLMIHLGLQAMNTEKTADLLTILALSLGVFLLSFYIRQRKWFLLGGISLCCIAVYLHMRIFPNTPWWVFLLIAGILLIGIAAANEMCKQKGESLKAKAGRLWEDWEW